MPSCNLECKIPRGVDFIRVPVINISIAGLSLSLNSQTAFPMSMNTIYERCNLKLPDTKDIECTLLVRHIMPVTANEGASFLQVGCQFLKMPAHSTLLVQRYLFSLERQSIMEKRHLVQ